MVSTKAARKIRQAFDWYRRLAASGYDRREDTEPLSDKLWWDAYGHISYRTEYPNGLTHRHHRSYKKNRAERLETLRVGTLLWIALFLTCAGIAVASAFLVWLYVQFVTM